MEKQHKEVKINKVISIIACLSIAVFAQNEQYQQPPLQQQQYDVDAEQQREKVQKSIKKVIKRKKNRKKATKDWTELVQEESLYLSFADKEYLYEKNMKKAAAGWAALNFFPGFGLGSYMQRDIASGVRQSVIDGIGFAILYIGFIITLPMVGDGDSDYKCDYECHYSHAKIVFNFGYSVLIAGRISGLIFPFAHQEKYNEVLKTALNINDISYSIDPLIVPKNEGAPAVGLAFNLRY